MTKADYLGLGKTAELNSRHKISASKRRALGSEIIISETEEQRKHREVDEVVACCAALFTYNTFTGSCNQERGDCARGEKNVVLLLVRVVQ